MKCFSNRLVPPSISSGAFLPLCTKYGKNNIGKVQYPILDNRYPIYMRQRIAESASCRRLPFSYRYR